VQQKEVFVAHFMVETPQNIAFRRALTREMAEMATFNSIVRDIE
jgi:ferredoxin-NADP reductase